MSLIVPGLAQAEEGYKQGSAPDLDAYQKSSMGRNRLHAGLEDRDYMICAIRALMSQIIARKTFEDEI